MDFQSHLLRGIRAAGRAAAAAGSCHPAAITLVLCSLLTSFESTLVAQTRRLPVSPAQPATIPGATNPTPTVGLRLPSLGTTDPTETSDDKHHRAGVVPPNWQDDAALNDVFFVDAKFGWAVGELGTIWHTQNGGASWRIQNSGVQHGLQGVHFVDRRRGWAVGGYSQPATHRSIGAVLTTDDGGQTWETMPGTLLPQLQRVHFVDARQGWAVGRASALDPCGVWHSRNGGRTWTSLRGVPGKHWVDASFQGASGVLLASDGTTAWVSQQELSGAVTQPATALSGESTDMGSSGITLVNGQIALRGPSRHRLGQSGADNAGVSPLLTFDRGRSWLPTSPLLPGASGVLRCQAMAAAGHHVWLAGSPGTRVFRTSDPTAGWQVGASSNLLPLRRVFFVDAQHGWAVGERGCIVSSSDGGQTWRTQRGASRRAAMVGVFADERDIPWQLLTELSAVRAYRIHCVLLTGLGPVDPLGSPPSARLQQAAADIGISIQWLAPRSCNPEVELSSGDWLQQVGGLDDPLGESITEQLTVVLRTWRPDVVLGSWLSPNPPQSQPSGRQQVVQRWLQTACEYAADENVYPQHRQWGLPPATVSRLLMLGPSKLASAVPSPLSKTNTARQIDAGRLTLAAERLANKGWTEPNDQTQNQSPDRRHAWGLFDLLSDAEREIGRNPLAGVVANYGSSARRKRDLYTTDKFARRRQQQAGVLVTQVAAANFQLAQVPHHARLLATMDNTLAAETLYELASQAYTANNNHGAAQLLQYLRTSYPDSPQAEHAAQWLVAYHTSAERLWRMTPKTDMAPTAKVDGNGAGAAGSVSSNDSNGPAGGSAPPSTSSVAANVEASDGEFSDGEVATDDRGRASAKPTRGAVQSPMQFRMERTEIAGSIGRSSSGQTKSLRSSVSTQRNRDAAELLQGQAGVDASSANGTDGKHNWLEGFRLARQLKSQRPGHYAQPEIAFPLVAIARLDGQKQAASALQQRNAASTRDSWWTQQAARELARQSDGAAPGDWLCAALDSTLRPQLDGRLDDACWQHAHYRTLQSAESNQANSPHDAPGAANAQAAETVVWVAHDQQFFYLAAACQALPGGKYLPPRRPRPRDPQLQGLDRLRLSLDINRDYVSAWQFEIDHRGWARESLLGDESWNPKYYVACGRQDDVWTLEVAIPLDELAPELLRRTGEVWNIGVTRLVPGRPSLRLSPGVGVGAPQHASDLQGGLHLQ